MIDSTKKIFFFTKNVQLRWHRKIRFLIFSVGQSQSSNTNSNNNIYDSDTTSSSNTNSISSRLYLVHWNKLKTKFYGIILIEHFL